MFRRRLSTATTVVLIVFSVSLNLVIAHAAEDSTQETQWSAVLAKKAEPPRATPARTEPRSSQVEAIEATIINPVRSANIGTEVGGVIEAFHFEEGQLIKKGQPVLEISKKRYEILHEKALESVKGLELAYKRAQQDAALKKELLASDAITRQEVLKAETEVEIAATRLEESKKDAALAKLNLDDCEIKAPFTGYLAVKYKQVFETVERLEKIFALVDSAKVYAVANVPEDLLGSFPMGTAATFEDAMSRRFTGTVTKIGKLIDPKSKTKRVYVLIDNGSGALEVGMTGSLHLGR